MRSIDDMFLTLAAYSLFFSFSSPVTLWGALTICSWHYQHIAFSSPFQALIHLRSIDDMFLTLAAYSLFFSFSSPVTLWGALTTCSWHYQHIAFFSLYRLCYTVRSIDDMFLTLPAYSLFFSFSSPVTPWGASTMRWRQMLKMRQSYLTR